MDDDKKLEIICGDALGELRRMKSGTVQTCVTSPPYWSLRDYGTARWEGGRPGCSHKRPGQRATDSSTLTGHRANGNHQAEAGYRETCGLCGARRVDRQVGLENTPEEYVERLVGIFAEVRRVLRDDGTLWLVLGDSYASRGQKTRDPGRSTKHKPFEGAAWKGAAGGVFS